MPLRLKEVAKISLGPAERRGILDKGGAEVVGGVAIARFGANPLQTIEQLKLKIAEIAPGLPSKKLADGTTSQLSIVPFYDRSVLIQQTLGTLEEALLLELLVTLLVVVVMVRKVRASLLIASLLPVAVLLVFVAMRYFKVEANIVALSGIAIAIGTMVDLGIVLTENILSRLKEQANKQPTIRTIYQAAAEVAPALLTAVATTIVSFIPVFTLEAAEGKLFGPLAFTKTAALIAALLVTLLFVPAAAHLLFRSWAVPKQLQNVLAKLQPLLPYGLLGIGFIALLAGWQWLGAVLLLLGLAQLAEAFISSERFKSRFKSIEEQEGATAPRQRSKRQQLLHLLKKAARFLLRHLRPIIVACVVLVLLAQEWLPLGPSRSTASNFLFVALLVGLLLVFFLLLQHYYRPLLSWCLHNKKLFLLLPASLLLLGTMSWLGFAQLFGFVATTADAAGLNIRTSRPWSAMVHAFPGIGSEFMPALSEGSYLLMPSAMPHAGISYNREVLQQLDRRVASIPEVELVVGKLGRAATALDPAPISMFENVVNYKPEYAVDAKGRRQRFLVDEEGRFVTRDGRRLTNAEAVSQQLPLQQLQPAADGSFYRNWRPHITSEDDIWQEIARLTQLPGVTSAPKLQPIETRLIMLQTGMRAPMGIKVYGPSLPVIQSFALQLEQLLQQVPSVKKEAVFADRIVGKPYLHLNIDRAAIARYGLSIEQVQQVIETAIGGQALTTTVEGRERYQVRLRYPRELRNSPEAIKNILVSAGSGRQIPLGQLVELEYVQGPQAIKSEDTFLVGYVLFDKVPGTADGQGSHRCAAADSAANCQRTAGGAAGGELPLFGQLREPAAGRAAAKYYCAAGAGHCAADSVPAISVGGSFADGV